MIRSASVRVLLVATVAGAVVLAIADAPQSIGLVFRVGVDSPQFAGEQLAIALAGAIGTALAVLFSAWWRWLLPAGALGVLVSHLIFNPGGQGITAKVFDPGETRVPPEFVRELPAAALGLAASGVLLIGLFGAIQRLAHEHPVGASVAAVAGCGGYLGASVVGPLRGVEVDTARLIVLAVAVVLTGAVLLLRETADPSGVLPIPARLSVAIAVLFTAAPTAYVAITGEHGFGTAAGGLVGLLILAAGTFAARKLGPHGLLATAAVGIALAAPATVLILFAELLIAGWGERPQGIVGLLAVLAAAGLAFIRRRLDAAAAALLLTALIAVLLAAVMSADSEFLVWALLATSIASVGLAIGATAPTFAARGALPAAAAVITTMALGVYCTLNFLRISGDGRENLEMLWGAGAFLTMGALLVIAAILLVLLSRLGRVRTDVPLNDQGPGFTATSAEPPETR